LPDIDFLLFAMRAIATDGRRRVKRRVGGGIVFREADC